MCNLSSKNNNLSIIVMFFCVILIPVFNIALFNKYLLSGVESCPLCMGKSMCDCFINDRFSLDWEYFWRNLLNVGFKNLQRRKQVIHGKCNNKRVVLKEISTRLMFDNYLTKNNKLPNSFKQIVNKLKITLRENIRPTGINPKFKKFNLCPNNDRFEIFLAPLQKYSDNTTNLYFNLKYMLEVNMEPIVQQVTKDWAVAPYLGSCGFIAVSENCGNSLTWFAGAMDWLERASVALQLLQFAFNATYDNPDFAFYFTDMSADNFALTSAKDVRLVDLENVIVVDKLAAGLLQENHQVYHDNSSNELIFSVEEICSHQISDFNIYSICKEILSDKADLITGGLLHSPPEKMQRLKPLIEDCVSPNTGASRFKVAYSIIEMLTLDINNRESS